MQMENSLDEIKKTSTNMPTDRKERSEEMGEEDEFLDEEIEEEEEIKTNNLKEKIKNELCIEYQISQKAKILKEKLKKEKHTI